jgi:hypothetical protein
VEKSKGQGLAAQFLGAHGHTLGVVAGRRRDDACARSSRQTASLSSNGSKGGCSNGSKGPLEDDTEADEYEEAEAETEEAEEAAAGGRGARPAARCSSERFAMWLYAPAMRPCPISTEGWTRRVHFVREGGEGGVCAADLERKHLPHKRGGSRALGAIAHPAGRNCGGPLGRVRGGVLCRRAARGSSNGSKGGCSNGSKGRSGCSSSGRGREAGTGWVSSRLARIVLPTCGAASAVTGGQRRSKVVSADGANGGGLCRERRARAPAAPREKHPGSGRHGRWRLGAAVAACARGGGGRGAAPRSVARSRARCGQMNGQMRPDVVKRGRAAGQAWARQQLQWLQGRVWAVAPRARTRSERRDISCSACAPPRRLRASNIFL